MSKLAGFWQPCGSHGGLLDAMGRCCSMADCATQQYQDAQFGVVCVDPVAAAGPERIARSPDGRLVLGISGHLLGNDKRLRTHPAQHCLDLYQEHGEDMASRLNGTFTLVVHDSTEGALRLITDRLNSRPLYYCRLGQTVLFANALPPILVHPDVPRALRMDSIDQFLAIAYLLGGDTHYRQIEQLPSSAIVRIIDGDRQEREYWQPRFDADHTEPLERTAGRIADAIGSAVRDAAARSGSSGVMLSGGLDSRVIASCLPQGAICMTLHNVNGIEAALARRVADALGHEHVLVRLEDDFPLGILERGALLADGMHGFEQAQPLFLEDTIRERGLACVFNGFGMDSYFSGIWMPRANWRHAPANEGSVDLVAYLARGVGAVPSEQLGQLIGAERAADAIEHARADLRESVERVRGVTDNIHDALALSRLRNRSRARHYLNLKALSDITREAAPMHDVGLIEAFLSTPHQHRFYARAYRRALQMIDPRMTEIPYSGTGVRIYQNDYTQMVASYLQRKVARRLGKLWHALKGTPERMIKSAWPDMAKTMRRHPNWHRTLREFARESWLADSEFIDGQGVADLIEDHISGRRDASRLLANWLTLEVWFRRYG